MTKKALFLATLLFFSLNVQPVSAQTVATPEQIAAIVQQITDLQVQLLLAKIAELKAQIQQIIDSQATQQTQLDTITTQTQPSAPVLGGTPVSNPVTISIGTTDCTGTNGEMAQTSVKIPVNITGTADHWEITYDGFQHTPLQNNVFSVLSNQPRVVAYVSPYKQGGTYGFITNYSATYPMVAYAYDAQGNELANSGKQDVVVSCPTNPNIGVM